MGRRPKKPSENHEWVSRSLNREGENMVPGHWRPPSPGPGFVWVRPHVRDGAEIEGTWRRAAQSEVDLPRMRVAPPGTAADDLDSEAVTMPMTDSWPMGTFDEP